MSRGGGWLTAGILLVVGSLCGGEMIRSEAIDTIKRGRGFDDTVQKMNSLSGAATLVNIAFIVGIIVGIVGIVLLVVDSGQRDSPSPTSPRALPSEPSATEEENRRLRAEVVQEENRRLRAEVERLRREREEG